MFLKEICLMPQEESVKVREREDTAGLLKLIQWSRIKQTHYYKQLLNILCFFVEYCLCFLGYQINGTGV